MNTPRVLAATAVLVALPVFACSRAQTESGDGARHRAGENRRRAGRRLADSWLTAKIQAQFFVDDDIKSRYINVSARDGVVKLKGFVESDDARRQVLEITRNTDGVKQIDERQLLVGRPASESFDAASTTFATAPVATTGVTPAAPAAQLDDSTVVSLVQAKYSWIRRSRGATSASSSPPVW